MDRAEAYNSRPRSCHCKAVFLDRDGTLSTTDAAKAALRDRAIGQLIGDAAFALTPDAHMAAFWRVREEPGTWPVNTLPREAVFWQRWYAHILQDHGAAGDLDALAASLYQRFRYHEMMQPYPEAVPVLEALRAHGYRLGVISDTFPSLELSLRAMGIAHFFDAFTASSIVGAGKPDPAIFQAATAALRVRPEECVFVDDCLEEADGARAQGFTAFHLDRERGAPDWDTWTLSSLQDLGLFLGLAGSA